MSVCDFVESWGAYASNPFMPLLNIIIVCGNQVIHTEMFKFIKANQNLII